MRKVRHLRKTHERRRPGPTAPRQPTNPFPFSSHESEKSDFLDPKHLGRRDRCCNRRLQAGDHRVRKFPPDALLGEPSTTVCNGSGHDRPRAR